MQGPDAKVDAASVRSASPLAEEHRRLATSAVRYEVREGGLEPPHPYGHRNLNPARLPIPPLARGEDEEPYRPAAIATNPQWVGDRDPAGRRGQQRLHR